MTTKASLDAARAYRRARTSGGGSFVLGWKLDRGERSALLARFPPVYRHVVADHVTLAAKVSGSAEVPDDTGALIVGRVDDGAGVEALVVEIAGTTDRPDGSTYHITWSLDVGKGRRAVESNDVIRERGWQPIGQPVPLRLVPGCWGPRR